MRARRWARVLVSALAVVLVGSGTAVAQISGTQAQEALAACRQAIVARLHREWGSAASIGFGSGQAYATGASTVEVSGRGSARIGGTSVAFDYSCSLRFVGGQVDAFIVTQARYALLSPPGRPPFLPPIRPQPGGRTVYNCSGRVTVFADYRGDSVVVTLLRSNGETRTWQMYPVPGGSGAEYASGNVVWATEGTESTLYIRGSQTLARRCRAY